MSHVVKEERCAWCARPLLRPHRKDRIYCDSGCRTAALDFRARQAAAHGDHSLWRTVAAIRSRRDSQAFSGPRGPDPSP